MSRWPADRYDKPIGTPITGDDITRAHMRAGAQAAFALDDVEKGRALAAKKNVDPAERKLRAEDILPPVEQFDPPIRYNGRLTDEQIQTIKGRLEEHGIAESLFMWPDTGPEPKHLIASRITQDKIRHLIEARYGVEVSSIAIVFKDGTRDYIVPPAE